MLNYKSDDITARVREFTRGQGVNVWYETHAQPDFLRIVDLMAQRGRIVIIAGTSGAAGLSRGTVLRQGFVAARFRHVQRQRLRAAPLFGGYQPLADERPAETAHWPRFPTGTSGGGASTA